MEANRKFIEDYRAVSAVIAVILMVAITVAIGATAYMYFTGMLGTPKTDAENAAVNVKTENGKIKITLTKSGDRMPDTGYTFSNSVAIRINGTELSETGITAGNFGWELGESLFIGGTNPTLDDTSSDVVRLGAGEYSVTVTVIKTVIFEDMVDIK